MLPKEKILKLLLEGTLYESEIVEFKDRLTPSNMPVIAKCVVAMANTEGGYIIIGVREKYKGCIISGIDNSANLTINELHDFFNKNLVGVLYGVEEIDIINKKILLISIEKSNVEVYFSRQESSPERQYYYTRSADGRLLVSDKKQYKYVYKYMTVDSFLNSLYNKSWLFFEPQKWPDKFERRFYCADYSNISSNKADTPRLFATCVTRTKNSEAAWKVYSHGQGLSAHCVQLELDVVELRKQLRASGLDIVEKVVEYKDDKYIFDLHKKSSSNYSVFFQNFSFRKFISLLSLKRDAYRYENEIRYFAIPSNRSFARSLTTKALFQKINIDWRKIIKSIRIDKKCSDAELAAIQNACFQVMINPVIKSYTFITGITPPKGSTSINCERFDIDDMPGGKKIKIE